MVTVFQEKSSQTEELGELVLLQLGADDTQPAGVVGMACPDLMLLGDEVELDPLAALAVHDALGPQDLAVVAGVQGREDPLNVRLGKHLGGLFAPGGEHLVGVVVMVVAGAVGIVALVVVVMVMRVFIVIVMVVMLLVVVMVMIVMVFVLLMRMLVVMVVMRMLVLRLIGGVLGAPVSYTHLTLPTIA